MPSRAATVRQRRLGAELRRLRERSDHRSAEDVATYLGWSPSKLSRIETAKIGVKVSDVRLLLELYDVRESHRGEVLALSHAATQQPWWFDYLPDISRVLANLIAIEDEADKAFAFAAYIVPGLLQTRGYAEYVVQSGNAITPISPARMSRLVELRMRRQEVLIKDNSMSLSVLLDEAVLLRLVGSEAIMGEQLSRLAELMSRPNILIRVLPLRVLRNPIAGEQFTVFEFSPAYDVNFPDILHLDALSPAASSKQEDDITYRYRLAWHALASFALGPDESRELIMRTAQELWRTS